jgi:hypothetical protein
MVCKLHIIPREGTWAVVREGNQRATSKHATRTEAIRRAKAIVSEGRTEIVIHGLDGMISEERSANRQLQRAWSRTYENRRDKKAT